MNFENIKLEKGMYSVPGKSFTQVLENLDPTENYYGTYFENTDAYQRQLKRFGIKTNGENCSKLSKFFEKQESAVLFPEHIYKMIRKGMESTGFYELFAAITVTDDTDYRPIQMTTQDLPQDVTVNTVFEGEQLREVDIKSKPLSTDIISLIKYGRLICCTYEALKNQNLEILNVFLRQVGIDIANELIKDLVPVIAAGTESINTSSITQGDLTLPGLMDLFAPLKNYSLNILFPSISSAEKIISLPNIQFYPKKSGVLKTSLGADMIKTSAVTGNTIYGFDKNYTVQMVQRGDILVDCGKAIDKQLDQTGVTFTAGFVKLNNNSIKKLVF